MGSNNTVVALYPSLAKRGKGRFYQHNFKIPPYPPLPKGDKNTRNGRVTHDQQNMDIAFHDEKRFLREIVVAAKSQGMNGQITSFSRPVWVS